MVQTFGAGRSISLRPGVVLGPREYVGRLPWWLRRVAAGGQVLAPGSPDRSIQPVDVRDLAAFALAAAERNIPGAYNVTAPIGRETFGDMLDACAEVTGSDAVFVWVPDERLLAEGVRQWSEMPLWRTFPGVWQVDPAAAVAAGLTCRQLADTVADTWAWLQDIDRRTRRRTGERDRHQPRARTADSRQRQLNLADSCMPWHPIHGEPMTDFVGELARLGILSPRGRQQNRAGAMQPARQRHVTQSGWLRKYRLDGLGATVKVVSEQAGGGHIDPYAVDLG